MQSEWGSIELGKCSSHQFVMEFEGKHDSKFGNKQINPALKTPETSLYRRKYKQIGPVRLKPHLAETLISRLVRIRQKWISNKGEVRINNGIGMMVNNNCILSARCNFQRLHNYWKQDITEIYSCLYKDKKGMVFSGYVDLDKAKISNNWLSLINLGNDCKYADKISDIVETRD